MKPVFILLFLLTLGTPLATMAADAGKPAAAKQGASTEELLARPPNGWKVAYQMNNGKTRITDFVPPKETDSDWTTKLTFESHADLVGSDPIAITRDMINDEHNKCSFLQHFNLFTGLENNYKTSAQLLLCGRSKYYGKGEVSIVKAIDGEDYFYIIRIQKFVKPFKINQSKFNEREMANWSQYFAKIKLCNRGSSKHPCPKPTAKH
ncbi:MAG TPA: hypothetical protein VJ998_02505 [Pseudomonadales bacterium]|nr:hypothetical protein [Pseudomonadales bacterium]